MTEVDGLTCFAVGVPILPRTHEGVLQYGQLILIVARVIEKSLYQAWRYGATSNADRPLDNGTHLFACHLRHEIVTSVDQRRESGEHRTTVEEVGAHREREIQRNVLLRDGSKDQVYILMRFVASLCRSEVGSAISEDLFKLVDEEAYVLGSILLDHSCQFGESVLAAAQYGVGDSHVHSAFLGRQTSFADHVVYRRFGEVHDRRGAWSDRHDVPLGAGAGNKAAVQHRQESGEHE